MSRHRFVRNLDLDEERDDGALSDGGDDMTLSNMTGLENVRAILGSEEQCGFTDSFIKESLWDCYFDVDKTVEWLKEGLTPPEEEQERKNAARERKETGAAFSDEDVVVKGMNAAQIHAARMAQLAEGRSAPGFTSFPNDHLPSIQPLEDYNSVSEADMYVRRLSTITERTEKTELTEAPPRSSQSIAFSSRRSPRALSSVTESSYGEVIESRLGRTNLPVDPNTIRPSPPPSALRLSRDEFEAYDSGDGESTRTVTPPLRAPSVPISSLDTIPDIPDNQTKSTRNPSSNLQRSNSAQRAIPVQVFKSSPSKGLTAPVDKPLPELPLPSEPRHSVVESRASSGRPRKSKLSALANSRVTSSKASTITQSSRLSSSTLGTSSVRTYPALRPSSGSELSLIEEETNSATSSIVHQALLTALNQEAADRSAVAPQKQDKEFEVYGKPTSEAKGGSPVMFYTAAESPLTSSSERPASKLAKLAQAKSKQGGSGIRKPKVPRSPSPSTLLRSTHTEYLTPIANGPTATTAITTLYQSLDHLISPARSVLPPSFPPAEHMSSSASSPEPKQSKLAMKAKKSHQKRSTSAEDEQAYLPVPVHAMFKPEGHRSHGIPLTSDEDKGHRKEHRDKLPRERRRGHGHSNPASPLDESTANVKASSPKRKSSAAKAASIPLAPLGPFAFDIPSPDDIVFNARRDTSLARSASDGSTLTAFPASTAYSRSSFTSAAKEREKAQKLAVQKKIAETQVASRAANRAISQKSPKAAKTAKITGTASGAATPLRKDSEQRNIDLSALGLGVEERLPVYEEPPTMTLAREKVLEEAMKALEAESKGLTGISLVIIGSDNSSGHVDAGKSTLWEEEKTKMANERASSKIGKGSFSWAWQFDGTTEERERGITMDIAVQVLSTPHKNITILDAPGHRDFIPNMISGASQADCALLVVGASKGEFEAGFDRGGQTREHVLLVRSLGVTQIVAAINKLDLVDWSKERYESICNQLKAFLVQSGFQASKTHFVPVGAMLGVNLVSHKGQDIVALNSWYSGPTLVELLGLLLAIAVGHQILTLGNTVDRLQAPTRDITSPLRFPVSNVFKGQGSSTGVWGRVCGGIVQVGERLRVLPGDETAVVKGIETETDRVQWAAAGSNVTLYLISIDPIHLSMESVLCPPASPVELASAFTARIIVFDIQVPILAGASRFDKGYLCGVQITIRQAAFAGSGARNVTIPLETFSTNKEMGRILVRRGGETIAAGEYHC
ncbi:hypothetical protein B0F90DRAFT_1667716 [Multifurca ochricompacta]|uniref:Tr-type G domain-containing protein n=1 Tax=Multifurca ochricompacta TaxID=376703 RepID=A0AAD4M767_9AGAM|nr:hypothetical protein B0F90DRAFT_1667716 [Multifurca ochricompacta]